MKGNFLPETWNYYFHRGITHNNVSEGYNSRLANHRDIGKHPNPYVLTNHLKRQLQHGVDEALCSAVGNPNKRAKNPKFLKLRQIRKNLMEQEG